MPLKADRWKHFLALIVIGDGVMAILRPQLDASAWAIGPQTWRDLMNELNRRPMLTRVIGGIEFVGGVYWALSHRDRL